MAGRGREGAVGTGALGVARHQVGGGQWAISNIRSKEHKSRRNLRCCNGTGRDRWEGCRNRFPSPFKRLALL